MRFPRRTLVTLLSLVMISLWTSALQTPLQPKVAPGPNEPDWTVVLEHFWGLQLYGDLSNPVTKSPAAVPGLFKKRGSGMVTYAPVLAFGTESVTRGGWYTLNPGSSVPDKRELWAYQFKNSDRDLDLSVPPPIPLREASSIRFDPGSEVFGIWVSNDNFDDGGVFSEAATTARINQRLADQPYKAMIYPFKEKGTGRRIDGSFVVGWEYSTNDDFQDVVCRIDNVDLVVAPEVPVPGRTSPGAGSRARR